MTPLAQKIAREMCKPLKCRSIQDRSGLASRIDEFHFFECSEIVELARVMASDQRFFQLFEAGAFLPAPLTWIEVSRGIMEHGLSAYLLVEDGDCAHVYAALDADGESPMQTGNRLLTIPLRGSGSFGDVVRYPRAHIPRVDGLESIIYALLVLINSPGRIQRTAHLPHAGLQREMARAKGMVGKFPLRAWTEMKLSVTRKADEGGGPRDTHLTGERALHFVRQHLRVVGGQLVYIAGHGFRVGGVEVQIPAHWRGNAANGIHRKRYAVTP